MADSSTSPRFYRDVSVAQKSAAVIAVPEDSGEFETDGLGIKVDGPIKVACGQAHMLNIRSICGHGIHCGSPWF
jgi:hypothetical protein